MKIKFCGLRHPQEFKLASTLGIEFTGIVHHLPSIRHVSEEGIAEIRKRLHQDSDYQLSKKPEKVLVVVNRPIQNLIDNLVQHPFDVVQLHGDEDHRYIKLLNTELAAHDLKTKVWKAVRIRLNNPVDKSMFSAYTSIKNFVVEMHHQSYGGAGIGMPESILQQALHAAAEAGKNIIAAGGIKIDSLDTLGRLAKQNSNLWGIDISSGIENPKGKKNAALMKDFKNKANKIFA